MFGQVFKKYNEKLFDFGGKKIILGGDFRQILPVVLNGGKVEILATSLKESYLWSSVQRFKLIQNMRVNDTPENKEYAKFLI